MFIWTRALPWRNRALRESQRRAAALARHLSTLTLLYDPHEALLIQRRAVELDPADAQNWMVQLKTGTIRGAKVLLIRA